jgi:hypothetical protein
LATFVGTKVSPSRVKKGWFFMRATLAKCA